MTAAPESGAGETAPKIVMPPLDARAPRPSVVRLRKSMVAGGALLAGALLAGALAWAFVIQPDLKAQRRAGAVAEPEPSARNLVRPSERVTAQPATYAQLDRLPEPRRLGGPEPSGPGHAPPSSAPPQGAAAPTPTRTAAPRPDPSGPARESGLFFASAGEAVRAPTPEAELAREARTGRRSDAAGDYAAVYNGHGLMAPLSPFELKAGALLPAALITAVDTSRGGPAIAVVTENVFDTVTGRHLLVPQGARLIGRHEGESRQGDKRAFLAWERLILPNGKSVVLAEAQGVDAQGAVGVAGRVDRHLRPLALATLFAGAITTLGQAARDRDDDSGGWIGNAGGAASIEAAQVGGKLVDRELAVRPVVRLAAGARVRVLLTRDLILEPYGS